MKNFRLFLSFLSNKKMLRLFQLVIFAQLLIVTQQLNAQILINPNFINTNSKPNFDLIFADEFQGNSLNRQNWDISTSDPQDDVKCFTYLYDFMLSQVSVSGGNCVLKTQKATPQNSNCLPFNNKCERGIAGEIKNSQWRDYDKVAPDFPNTFFQNYDFPVGSYVEIRAKTASSACNAGSSFWLIGGDQEIDVFETSGDEDDFTSGYWSARSIDGKNYGLYERYQTAWEKFWGTKAKTSAKIINTGFSMKKQISVETNQMVYDDITDTWSEQAVTKVTTSNTDPSEFFITYGIQFTKDGLEYFINNQNFYSYKLDDYDFKNGNLTEMRPKVVRLSTGQLTGGGSKDCSVPCPSQMEIDYVRVYIPKNLVAILWLYDLSVICAGREEIIKATYIPGVTYSWSSIGFDIEKEWSGSPDSNVKIKSKNGILSGTYPITVVSTFPDGHTETLTKSISVSSGGTVAPPASFNMRCEDNLCYGNVGEPFFGLGCNCTTPNIYEWSDDNGLTWHNYGTHYAFSRRDGSYCVRTRNCNGTSSQICLDIPQNIRVPNHSKISKHEIKPILYPNPVGDFIPLQNIDEISKADDEFMEAFVFDISGKLYFNGMLGKDERVDVSNLPNGIYLLALKWGKENKENKENKKIIKFTKTN